jgi:hypothetical protein
LRKGGRQVSGRKSKFVLPEGEPYRPRLYPGRRTGREIHVFDRHGKVKYADAFAGVGHGNGIAIDKHDHLIMMVSARRLRDGKHYDPTLGADASDTLVKVKAGKTTVLSSSRGRNVPVPLARKAWPERPPEIRGGRGCGGPAWVNGAEWFYGGVGFDGSDCCCWNARFTLDLLGRSFAPELRHYSVAVLDTAGNLILRVGRYGNADDGVPLIRDPDFGDPKPIGGDEVSLFHAPYVATHTDRRLFIADPGNARVLSVKLGYHAEETMPLKNVPDPKRR